MRLNICRAAMTVSMLAVLASCAGAVEYASDLNPVKLKATPAHAPVVLVADGEAKASIIVMDKAAGAADLQKYIRIATGATLPIVKDKIAGPAIVLGDCAEAAAVGLAAEGMPPEGFAIKTTPDAVFIVGQTQWGSYEFLERFVGMRWYFPQPVEGMEADLGQSIPKTTDLAVQPVWLEDAPAFPMRIMWPPCSDPWHGSGLMLGPIQTFLRHGNTHPIQLRVHQPNWSKVEDYRKNRPEVFQLKADGRREWNVLCYGNAKTLETYLEGIQGFVDGKPGRVPIAGKAITVSPADVEISCYCDDCRRMLDKKGGQYGTASVIMATFVDKLAREVEKRWPDEGFTVIFLPYLNYTAAPDGFKFPGNVEVQICGMPGLASYKEPAIRDSEQANIDKWIAVSGRKIQNWHYDVWPAHKTKAAYQYPHVCKDFYRRNRDKTIGSFINGDFNHWPRQHISLYCWLKCLWSPDFDVDAAVYEFCRRMFGPAERSMRKLVGMQMDGWEKSLWPGGRFSPKGIYEVSFPRETVVEMEKLWAQVRAEGDVDPIVKQRLDYYEPALMDFFKESRDLAEGTGFKALSAQKVGDLPVIDGKLDDPVWQRAEGNGFVQAGGAGKGKPARYKSEVKALWGTDGIVFGLHLWEPTPQLLERKNGGHDNGNMWWDDNVEIFVDVTGKSEGEFYQFIVNPDVAYWDSKGKDTSWECEGFRAASHVGKDFWSLEVFLPYKAFPEAAVPGSGTHTQWTGNFTRHRVADKGLSSDKPQQEGSTREYSRMNTTGSKTSDNLADFAPIKFIE